ncbi:hypothetical protein C8J55DRAFT_553945 [Lentinula edodes]|uniref:SHSP domain-containing protein n=1 Tax=Lentinula lateritia TaxID=40482 RepID=A0A9W9B212_9AGAR|nr:hypothetical protein C8J55DRAFT_553945 [Lentinula edodes]
MEHQANFESMLHLIRPLSSGIYTPRVDSCYEPQNRILSYSVELPGVRRQHIKVTIGYSPIFKQRNIAVWGMSLAPYWPVDRIIRLGSLDSLSMPIVPIDEQLHTGELRRPVAPSNHATMAQPQQLMTERVHGEFYRLLAIPNNAQDVTAILSNGILLLTIKCDEPLTHDEIRVTQEVVEVH